MSASTLRTVDAGELGLRIDADFGPPSLRAVVIEEASASADASRIIARLFQQSGRAVIPIEDPPDAWTLARRVARAGTTAVVVSGLEGFQEEEWKRLDLLRSRLRRGGSLCFLLSARALAFLERNAPNLASWMGNPLVLMEGETPSTLQTGAEIQAEFDRLSRLWLEETMMTSSLTKKVDNPAYQAIIAMGKSVIPPILRDLERQPKLWGPALHAITGANPVRKADEGKVRLVAASWLRWAKDNGYEW